MKASLSSSIAFRGSTENMAQFWQLADEAMTQVSQAAFKLLTSHHWSESFVKQNFVARDQLDKLSAGVVSLLNKTDRFVCSRGGQAIAQCEKARCLAVPKSTVSLLEDVEGKLKELSIEQWNRFVGKEESQSSATQAPNAIHINKFVKRFNRDLENRKVKQREALDILYKLRDHVWKRVKGVRIRLRDSRVANARQALFKMFHCKDAKVKERALQYFIEIVESDPLVMKTAYDLVDLQERLWEQIRQNRAQNLNTRLQRLLIKAYAVTLECILLHAGAKHLNGLVEEVKIKIWDGASELQDLNVINDPEIEFWTKYAVQAANRIKTEVADFKKWFGRITMIARAGVKLASLIGSPGDAPDVFQSIFNDFVANFSHLARKKAWFEELLVLRKFSRYALNDIRQFWKLAPLFQATKSKDTDFELLYGVLITLEDIIKHSPSKLIKEEGIKLLLQYITHHDPCVQTRVLRVFRELLYREGALANTAYVVLRLLRASGVADELDIWINLENHPKYIQFHRRFARSNLGSEKEVYHNVVKFIIRRLAEIKGDRDHGGHSFVTLLCSSSNKEMILPMLRCMADLSEAFQKPDVYGNTPYHLAATEGNLEMLSYAHEAMDFNIDEQEFQKSNTALHIAVEKGNGLVATRLLELGVSPNIENADGNTPLHLAVALQSSQMVELLLRHQAKNSVPNNNGQTALNIAIERDNPYLVKLLLDYNAKTAEHAHRFTPIIVAAQAGAGMSLMELLERKKEALTRLEALEILRMISRNGMEITASEEFCRYHLKKLSEDVRYYIDFEEYGSFPHVAVDGENHLFLEGKRQYTYEPRKRRKGSIVLSLEMKPVRQRGISIIADDFGNNKMILNAASEETLSKFTSRVEKARNVNSDNYFGVTALHVAVLFHNVKAAEVLLGKEGINVNQPDCQGFTPLHFAAWIRDYRMVELLIKNGADPNLKNDFGDTPLLIFCGSFPKRSPVSIHSISSHPGLMFMRGDEESMIKMFCKGNADMQATDAMGNNALHHAVCNGTEASVSFLFKRHPELMWHKNNKGSLPLEEAIRRDSRMDLDLILQADMLTQLHQQISENTGNRLVLGNLLAYAGRTSLLKSLLKADPKLAKHTDSTPRKAAPLHVAAEKGNLSILKMYRKVKLSINIRDGFGNTPAHLAVINNQPEFLAEYIRLGGNLLLKNQDGRTALHLAATQEDNECFRLLIEHPKIVQERDGNGDLALHLACKFKCFDKIKELVEMYPESVHEIDDDMNTPFHHACMAGNVEIVTYLAQKGVNTGARNIFGETPLIVACNQQKRDVVAWLLDQGVSIRARDEEGETALHTAVFHHNYPIAKLLIDVESERVFLKGEKLVNIADIRGEIPLHELVKKGENSLLRQSAQERIMKLLLEHGSSLKHCNEHGENFLHIVCKHGLVDLFHICLRYLDVKPKNMMRKVFSYRDLDYQSVLHKAAAFGHHRLVKELVEAAGKMKINQRNNNGETALLLAMKNRHYKVASYLMDHGAHWTKQDKLGRTILHHLLTSPVLGDNEAELMIKMIGRKPELLTIEDEAGRTPFHILAEYGHNSAIDFLLENLPGKTKDRVSYFCAKDGQGRTAEDLATEYGHLGLAERIRKYPKVRLGRLYDLRD